VDALLQGRFSDYAHGLCMMAIFAGVYVLLRVALDKLIPGNVQVPVLMDKIGAGVLGFIAGIFTAGTIGIAAQTMPFGPSIGMHERFSVADREVRIPDPRGQRQTLDAEVWDELTENTFEKAGPNRIILPVDDIVLNFTSHLSTASMSGKRPLRAIHPDYLQELFGQRIAVQPGARLTAYNGAGQQQVKFDGAYYMTQARQVDAEILDLRSGFEVAPEIRAAPDEMLLVVRATFDNNAADERDKLVRIGPSAVRLVAAGKNYYPIGTYESGRIWANRIDDKLFLATGDSDKSADFVFLVKTDDVVRGQGDRSDVPVFIEGTFLEVKRLARFDLGGKTIESSPLPPVPGVLRKPQVVERVNAPQQPAK
jgi:hypothetical protein